LVRWSVPKNRLVIPDSVWNTRYTEKGTPAKTFVRNPDNPLAAPMTLPGSPLMVSCNYSRQTNRADLFPIHDHAVEQSDTTKFQGSPISCGISPGKGPVREYRPFSYFAYDSR
jgi:hypothetical protein